MVVHDPSHPLDAQQITEDRECPGCGYNLRGLARGGKCPECGRSIGARARGRLVDEITRAPTSYLKTLRIGLALMCVSILASCLPVVGTLGYSAGVWIALIRRPESASASHDWLLDNGRLRLAGRALTLLLVPGSLLALAGNAAGGGVIGTVLLTGAALCFAGGAIGFVPVCAYLSALADWASYDNLAGRLRASTWLMSVGGVVTALLWAIPATRFFALWTGFALIAAGLLFLLGLFQLAGAVSWAVNNQAYAEGSAARVAEARERRDRAPNAVHGLRCRKCKYDLEGLPLGGACPECGESYADLTGLPVRDPPKRDPENETPIPLADDEPAESKQIRHSRHLSDPDSV